MGISDRELRRIQADVAHIEPQAREAFRAFDKLSTQTLDAARQALEAAPSAAEAGELRRMAEQVADTPMPPRSLLEELRDTHAQLIPDDAVVDAASQTVNGRLNIPDPATTRRLHSLVRVFEEEAPPNWHGYSVSHGDAWRLATDEGLVLIWIPRGEIVVDLVGAPDEPSRREILDQRGDDIVHDCLEAVDVVEAPKLSECRNRVREALRAYREGHRTAAQALAAAAFTYLGEQILDGRKLSHLRKVPWYSSGEVTLARYRVAVLVDAAIVASAQTGRPGTSTAAPGRFNRNATVHNINDHQYTSANAVSALMLASALLVEAQTLTDTGDL